MPDPIDILQAMMKPYKTCKTYRDHGEALMTIHSINMKEEKRRKSVKFQTDFRRPDQFRFEFEGHDTDPKGNPDVPFVYVIWSDGEKVQSWWSLRQLHRELETVPEALGAARAISCQTSEIIYRFLFANLSQMQAGWQKAKLEVLPSEVVDERDCHLVRETWPNRGSMVYYVDKETPCLRRLRITQRFREKEIVESNRQSLNNLEKATEGVDESVRERMRQTHQDAIDNPEPFSRVIVIDYRPEFNVEIADVRFKYHLADE